MNQVSRYCIERSGGMEAVELRSNSSRGWMDQVSIDTGEREVEGLRW